jgi:Domain of unknown function (DUF4349)
MDTEDLGWRGPAAVVVVVVGLLIAALVFMGGQTSTILSNVGSAIGNENGAGDPASDPASGQQDTGTPAGEGEQVADAGGAAALPELLIIRTGHIEVEVGDLATAVASARTRILAVGGYVSASDESASDDQATASAVYRVPANRWDEAVEGIRGLASEVRGQQVETEAVTAQVVDLGARITNLRASEAALQAIMTKATKIADVLAVQGELTTVRGEIERLVAEKALLEERAAYGTLTVSFSLPVTPATEEVRRGWDPATDADRATGTLISLGQAAMSSAIWLGIVGLPLLIVGMIVAFLAWRIGRLVSRRAAAESGPT